MPPPCLPATVSPSQSPVRLLDDASSGLSEMSWVMRTLPLRSWPPFLCLRFPWCLSSLAAFLCPGSSQPGDPDSTARQMAESPTARSGRSSGMRPDISSGDQCSSRMSLTASERLSGSSMSLGRLQRSLLLSAFLCAVDARQRRPAGPCQPFRPISRDMAGLSLWSSLAIWLTPSWPFQRTMMSSRSAMPRWP